MNGIRGGQADGEDNNEDDENGADGEEESGREEMEAGDGDGEESEDSSDWYVCLPCFKFNTRPEQITVTDHLSGQVQPLQQAWTLKVQHHSPSLVQYQMIEWHTSGCAEDIESWNFSTLGYG